MTDEDLKNANRASSLDAMSQEEKDAYAKDGINAKIVPLFFTDEGKNYKNFAECYEANEEQIKNAKPKDSVWFRDSFDFQKGLEASVLSTE
jgi:hypothetical protein